MSKKVPVKIVDQALTDIRAKVENNSLDTDFIDELRAAIIQEEEEKLRQKRTKKEMLVIKREDDIDGNSTGWVVTLNEGVSPSEVTDKLIEIKHSFNMSKKGRKTPVNTTGEIFANVAQRFFKEHGLMKMTKEAVYLIQEN